MKASKKIKQHVPYSFSCETFNRPWNVTDCVRFNEPSAFNGNVSFRRYKVTVEEIPESKEVLKERLIKLWRECDNHHHMEPLKDAAALIGFELNYLEYGSQRKAK